MKRTATLLALALLLILANVAMISTGAIRAHSNVAPAAGSANYKLSWFTPMTSAGVRPRPPTTPSASPSASPPAAPWPLRAPRSALGTGVAST